MSAYRIVIAEADKRYLVHVGGDQEETARKAAIEKVALAFHLPKQSLRVKRSERIAECV